MGYNEHELTAGVISSHSIQIPQLNEQFGFVNNLEKTADFYVYFI